MNSRERILAAVSHRQPDRVPIDFGGHRSSGVAAATYAKFRKHLGLCEEPLRVYDMIQQLAIIDDDILDMFSVDAIEMGRGFCLEDKDWKDWVLPDGTPCQIPYYIDVEKRGNDWILKLNGNELSIQKQGCLYFEQTYFPLAERDFAGDDFADLEDLLGKQMWAVPHPGAHLPLDDEGLEQMSKATKNLRKSTDKAIIGLFGGSMFEMCLNLCRMDNFLVNIALYPEATHRLLEKLCKIHLESLEKWMAAVGEHIDIVVFGDDLGGQSGPLISLEMYREFIKPYHKKLWQRTKQLGDVKTLLHCCGSIAPFMEDFIEIGLDAVNPVQISAEGMDAVTLKEKFGSDICLWGGGCDTRDVLPNATPEQVRKHVKENVEIMSPDGGFVFQQVHNILAGVPAENIVAMFEAVNG